MPAYPEFVWLEKGEIETKNDPKLIVHQYGAGYKAVFPAALNHHKKVWSIPLMDVPAEIAAQADAFLAARGGYEPFTWYDPEGRAQLVRCPSWTLVNHTDGISATLTATFEEV